MVNWDFQKFWGWAVGQTINKEGKKIEIFQSLGVGDNASMDDEIW